MIKHSQITQTSKLAISLQYLRKEVRDGGHFWQADKRQSFSKLVLSFLVEVARHVQNTQNRRLVIFSRYIKKKLLQLLCVLLWWKIFKYFKGSSHVRCCLLFQVLIKWYLRFIRKPKPNSACWHFNICDNDNYFHFVKD